MAGPFEQRPTFGEFIQWAENQGCQIKYGHAGVMRFVEIKTPQGRTARVPGVLDTHRINPTFTSWLHRALGMKSPWAGAPEPYD